jgi:hypothetical protein
MYLNTYNYDSLVYRVSMVCEEIYLCIEVLQAKSLHTVIKNIVISANIHWGARVKVSFYWKLSKILLSL